MLRITSDVNVLVSATLVKGNCYEIIRLAKTGKIILILSIEILCEFKEVISRPKFHFSEEQIRNSLKEIMNVSEIVAPTTKLEIVEDDPDDNIILSTAIDGKAEYLATGDPHLLKIKNHRSIKIVKPAEILKIFYG